MPTPFPGMDPYLERPDLWPHVHSRLIVALADDLAPRLRPRYYVAVEERLTRAAPADLSFAVRPDVALATKPRWTRELAADYVVAPPMTFVVEVPMIEELRETYLEIRSVPAGQVVTVIEVLSPTNKRPGAGRQAYLEKRTDLLGSPIHLVEIDLLRAGEPMPMYGMPTGFDYRVLVSRGNERPLAELLVANVRQPLPSFAMPLLPEDNEPMVELNRLLHELYDRAGFDLRIDYSQPAEPPLAVADAVWAAGLLEPAQEVLKAQR